MGKLGHHIGIEEIDQVSTIANRNAKILLTNHPRTGIRAKISEGQSLIEILIFNNY